jgi:hypothetical protein
MIEKKYRGQIYQQLGEEPYTRKRDGVRTTLKIWRSWCAHCGCEFEFKTPSGEVFAPNRRCKPHQRPGILAGRAKR